MKPRHKLNLIKLASALILLPLSFAGAAGTDSPAKRITALSGSTEKKPYEEADGKLLFLSKSLTLVPPAHTDADETSVTEHSWANSEPLVIPLSQTLSLSSLHPITQKASREPDQDNEDLLFAQNKGNDVNEPTSREALFGDELPKKTSAIPAWKRLVTGWKGFSQLEIADTYSSPEHLSKAKLRTELSRTGQFNEHIKWKISGRFDYDAAYDISSNFYPEAVRQNQRAQFFVRENYVVDSAGNFDFRLRRQHVIWWEMVGLFFADVVSAKDLREFVLPSFDIIRIPQWAVRAEYTRNNTHAEVVWIPVPTLDEIGRPGADFYPGPLRGIASYLPEDRSRRNVANSNYGIRLSHLINGWDISAFYYNSLDASSTFYRVSGPAEPIVFQPRHDRIDQAGATLAKDFGSVVLKGELIYTDGRKFNTFRPTAIDGLVKQNTLDYVVGLDFNLPAETRLNLQFFQRVFFAHDPDIVLKQLESGASILLNGKLWNKVEAQALLIHSLNRSDWMFRPRLSWNFERNWRWALGADIFGGQPIGLFGRFNHVDRVYTEVRYSF